jgi:hypothetical protein
LLQLKKSNLVQIKRSITLCSSSLIEGLAKNAQIFFFKKEDIRLVLGEMKKRVMFKMGLEQVVVPESKKMPPKMMETQEPN